MGIVRTTHFLRCLGITLVSLIAAAATVGILRAGPIESVTMDTGGNWPRISSNTVGSFTVTNDKLAHGVSTPSGNVRGGTLPPPNPLIIVDELFVYSKNYNANTRTTSFRR